MVRRIPKFPLKMANGANVRSIEELRSNADVQTIVSNYLSGKLSLWCRAFGYNDLPERFDIINYEMIKSIYNALGITANEVEIRNFIEDRGMNGNNSDTSSDDGLVELDEEYLKGKLSHLDNAEEILSVFTIKALLLLNDDGCTGKYRVDVEESEMGQYMSFVSPYKADKADDSLEQLYQNIAYTVENMSVRATIVKKNFVMKF